jgi:hypothetical protein
VDRGYDDCLQLGGRGRRDRVAVDDERDCVWHG